MTSAQHRSVVSPPATFTTQRDLKGAAPHGMWWVAWRQQRLAIGVAAIIMLVLAGALVAFRFYLFAQFRSLGCSVTDQAQCNALGMSAWTTFASLENQWRVLHGVLIAAPIVLGVFVGAPLFAREFSHGTHVFALTQSVRRIRWWATKFTVVAAPLLAGMVGLGYLTHWADDSTWLTKRGGLYDGTFQVQAIMPAAFALVAVTIAGTAGILLRSVLRSLVVALVVAGGVIIVLAFPLRTHLAPTVRLVSPISDVPQVITPAGEADQAGTATPAPGSLLVGSGFIDANGHEVAFDAVVCNLPPSLTTADQAGDDWVAAYNKALAGCWRDQGIVGQYQRYILGTLLWTLRWTMTGICAALAALFLALGAWRLPRSVAKR